MLIATVTTTCWLAVFILTAIEVKRIKTAALVATLAIVSLLIAEWVMLEVFDYQPISAILTQLGMMPGRS